MLNHVAAIAVRGAISYALNLPVKTAVLYNIVDMTVSALASYLFFCKYDNADLAPPLLAGRVIGVLAATGLTYALLERIDLRIAILLNISSFSVSLFYLLLKPPASNDRVSLSFHL